MICKLETLNTKAVFKTNVQREHVLIPGAELNRGCPDSMLRTYYRTGCMVAKELGVRKDQRPELTHDKWGDTILRWCPGCPRRLGRPVSR